MPLVIHDPYPSFVLVRTACKKFAALLISIRMTHRNAVVLYTNTQHDREGRRTVRLVTVNFDLPPNWTQV
jgi:hypothetical protein